jgi:hypothetical protein
MKEPRFVTYLKAKWNITSNKDFILIMLAFSLAGMMICVVRPMEFALLHLNGAPTWLKVVIYPVLVIPSYYLGLVFWGFILGQSKFCNWFALNFLRRIGRLFGGTASNK